MSAFYDEAKTPSCGAPEPVLFNDNSTGVIAPSVTARDLMAEDGFVENGKTEEDE